MKKISSLIVATIMICNLANAQQNFTLKSANLNGQATTAEEFNGFGCSGKNQSPQLNWANAPEGTKSFAITMYDKDAPTGSGFWHWIIFDLPLTTTELKANAGNVALKLLPSNAIQGKTDYGVPGYGGPCPPVGHGIHQYIFTIYALKTEKLGLDANASAAVVGFYINQNVLAQSSIVAYYKR